MFKVMFDSKIRFVVSFLSYSTIGEQFLILYYLTL